MNSAEFSLQAIDLCKDYKEGSGEALHVLRNINFTLRAGETAAIIGSSGSGKSTPVSYTHLTLPTRCHRCRSRGSA